MIVTLPLRRKTDLLQSDIIYFSIIKSPPAKPEVGIVMQYYHNKQRQLSKGFFPSLHANLHAVQNSINLETTNQRLISSVEHT